MTTAQIVQQQFEDPERAWLRALIIDAAKANGLSPALALGVASRETEIRNIAGDYEAGHGYHGYGPMQLDDRSHAIPDGWQQHPGPILNTCCAYLAGLIQIAKSHHPDLDYQKIALAAYNEGMGNAERCIREYSSVDHGTTGGNYGADSEARAAEFARLLGG